MNYQNNYVEYIQPSC